MHFNIEFTIAKDTFKIDFTDLSVEDAAVKKTFVISISLANVHVTLQHIATGTKIFVTTDKDLVTSIPHKILFYSSVSQARVEPRGDEQVLNPTEAITTRSFKLTKNEDPWLSTHHVFKPFSENPFLPRALSLITTGCTAAWHQILPEDPLELLPVPIHGGDGHPWRKTLGWPSNQVMHIAMVTLSSASGERSTLRASAESVSVAAPESHATSASSAPTGSSSAFESASAAAPELHSSASASTESASASATAESASALATAESASALVPTESTSETVSESHEAVAVAAAAATE